MTRKPEEIFLRDDDEVQFILGKPPGWMLRWGISATLAGAILAAWAAWVIRYPDVVSAPVSIVTERPSVRMVSVAGGKIAALPVEDKQVVAPGDILAVMENPAQWEQVLALEQYLRKLPPDSIYIGYWLGQWSAYGISPSWTLGGLQTDFAGWMDTHLKLRTALQNYADPPVETEWTRLLRERSLRLFNEIQAWKQDWLVVAPDSGIVSLAAEWTPGQYVSPGQEIMTLVAPHGKGFVKAQGFLPTAGAGKVAPGMSVRIHLAGFPFREYGALPGKVKDISLAPVNTGDAPPSYRIEIELPQGLKTDYGRELPMLHEAQGNARIITEKRNLLQRLFAPLYNRWKNSG